MHNLIDSVSLLAYKLFLFFLQQFGKILDVEIIFNERGSKVSNLIHFRIV